MPVLNIHASGELAKEAHVVLEVMAEVVDLPFEHGNALHAHTEGEAVVLLGVDARCLKHVGVYHAAAQDFQPAGTLADVTALAMANIAADVYLCRRFREREIRRPHANLGVRAEHLSCKQEDSLLKIGESNVFIDIKTLHLMENAVRAGRNGLIAEYASRANHADRQLVLFHCTNLHAGRMGTQQQRVQVAVGHKESILHIARRVVRREVQSLEHMVIILNLRALCYVIAKLAEYINNLLPGD